MSAMEPVEPLWDVNDVAAYTKCSVHTVRGWVANEKVPFLKVAGNVRFVRGEVEAWARTREGSKARHPMNYVPEPVGERA